MSFSDFQPTAKNKNILLVEDEALIAMNEAALLEKHGYQVKTVHTGKRAIEAVSQNDVDLILMDIDLGRGKMDGTEAAEIILQHKEVPIVFLSSHTEPEVVEKTEGITSYGYIVKNSGETVLIASLKMAFRLFESKMKEKESKKELLHSRDLMRYIIEHNRSAAAVHDRNLNYLYVSKQYLEQYRVQEKDIIGKHHYDVFPDLPQKWRDVHRKALAGEISSAEDDPYERADGTVDWTRWECRPWYEADGSIGGIIIYTEVMNDGLWDWRVDTGEAYFSPRYYSMLGYEEGEFPANYESFKKWVQARGKAIDFDDTGKPTRLIGTHIDIDNRKQMENELKNTIHELNIQKDELEVMQKASMSVLEYSSFHDSAKKIFDLAKESTGAQSGYVALLSEDGSENEVLFLDDGGLPCTVDPSLPMPIRGLREKAYRTGKAVIDNDFMNSEWVKYMPAGHVMLKNVLFAPLPLENRVVGLFGLANKDGDFTEQNLRIVENLGKIAAISLKNSRSKDLLEQREKELEKAIEEKNYLMKELNHRVKNNLAMVSSLVNLKADEQDTAKDFSDIKQQIDAIRIVHEQLYQSEEITRIDFKKYTQELLTTIFNSFSANRVIIENQIEHIFIGSDKAIPLGLIINEIATNAIKHGFSKEKQARFTVKLMKNKNQATFTLSNTGKPFPKDISFKNPKTLGLQLISVLVSQIDGTIELQREPHPVFTIRFCIN